MIFLGGVIIFRIHDSDDYINVQLNAIQGPRMCGSLLRQQIQPSYYLITRTESHAVKLTPPKRNIIATSGETEDTTSMTADIEMARDGKGETWYILIFPDDESTIEFYEAEILSLRLKYEIV